MKKRSDNSIHSMSKNKKAQLKISFGMIFSIILVISFLAFGFFAIQKFLGIQENIIMKKFVDDFQCGKAQLVLKNEYIQFQKI
jgi:uncharacterized protein (UPF0333 family)